MGRVGVRLVGQGRAGRLIAAFGLPFRVRLVGLVGRYEHWMGGFVLLDGR